MMIFFAVAAAKGRAGTWVLVALLGFLPAAWAAEIGWPGIRYDADIPTHQQVLGYQPGETISSPEYLDRYLAALAAAAPERTQLVEYARSWQGRPLSYLVIGSAANIARLDEIKASMRTLADPRDLANDEVEALIASTPALVWLAHGVHGNEISSPEAALVTAYHLLAADAGKALLDDTLVIVDPVQNPDGRARFVQHYRSLYGIEPQGSSIAAERVEGWPSGRTNHYLFDMNRDWFALTQPEVAGRVEAFLEYHPLVYVDLHEMGSNRTFYFPPPAEPYNPYLADAQFAAYAEFGRHTGARFDEFGFRYFTRETYDAYYPGYGDTWPTLQGALGMTFEMASARGLVANREDGSQLSYSDGVQRHFVASVATIETAVRTREKLLREFVAFRGNSETTDGFLLPRQGDVGRVDKLARLLERQGIEVRQLPESRRVCGRNQPAGSYLISGAQPAGRLASTLLADDSPINDAFWAEQKRRLDKGLEAKIYDIVAWSLPLLWGVDVESCRIRESDAPLAAEVTVAAHPLPEVADVAYLVPWGSQAAARFLAGALRQGLRVESSDKAFSQNDREYQAGVLVLRVSVNSADLHDRVTDLAMTTAAEVVASNSSWVEDGVNFGSDEVRKVPRVKVAIVWGAPAAVSSAGSLRYVLEQKIGYPVVPVRPENLASLQLDEFDVLLLPDGRSYPKQFPAAAAENIERWVRQGGTLIGVGGALSMLARNELGLLDTLPERRVKEDADENGDADTDEADDVSHNAGSILEDDASLSEATAPLEENPLEILGAILNADVDTEHWLAAGLPETVRFIVGGDRVFSPIRLDKGRNVVNFAAADALAAAGHLWGDSRDQWALKPALMASNIDRGIVIGFAADPSFRGYLDGLDVLVANAVFRGAAHARPVRRVAQ